MELRITATRLAGLVALAAAAAIPSTALGNASAGPHTPDGTHVVFRSDEQLVAADTDTLDDVYERFAGQTRLVSAPGAGASGLPKAANPGFISDDGATIIFFTSESLVGTDTDGGFQDVYQRSGGVTTLVSVEGAGASGPVNLSAGPNGLSTDGSRVIFTTQQNLIGADTDGLQDVYERSGGTTTLVSAPGVGAVGPAAFAVFRHMSPDATRVSFETTERLLTGDSDTVKDVYQGSGGATTLVSAPGAGASGPALEAKSEGISADGSRVFFSTAENLLAADADGQQDVYERSSGATNLISVPGAGAGTPTDGSFFTGATPDGTHVYFETIDDEIAADTDGINDIYERFSGSTSLVSPPGSGAGTETEGWGFERSSSDGSKVFLQTPDQEVSADTDGGLPDVYQSSAGVTTLVSAPGIGASGPADGANFTRASADGSKVYFFTAQRMAGEDTDSAFDTYERSVGFTTLASLSGAGGNGPAGDIFLNGITADAGHLYFNTPERLTGSDFDDTQDIYERTGGTTTMVSIEAGPPTGIPPATTLDSGPSGTITDSTPTFGFSADEQGSSFQCKVDGGAFTACSSPTTTAALGAGSHKFQVRAVDIVGNVDGSPASRSFTIPDKCGGRTTTITGTPGADTITGTGGVDVVSALGGKDKVRGLGGGDLLCGGAGNDTLLGGGGPDKLFGQAGKDVLRGGPARDKLVGGPGGDVQVQ